MILVDDRFRHWKRHKYTLPRLLTDKLSGAEAGFFSACDIRYLNTEQ